MRRKPLDRETIANIPTKIFHKNEANKDTDKECSICLTEFEEGEEIAILPCLHRFHKSEIFEWFKRQKTCPIDKTEVKFSV